MTLAITLLAGIERTMATWAAALRTLPDPDLRAQREALRSSCEHSIGVTSAALVLKALDDEIARRRGPQGELELGGRG